MFKGWRFHYNGWEKSSGTQHRNGATKHNLFPSGREGALDKDALLHMGLTKERMCGIDYMPDALFFYQLILPMCDPMKSGIEYDPRLAYYTDVTKFSNLYAIQTEIAGAYGHKFDLIRLDETITWDMIIIRDGVLGGSNGALYMRWVPGTLFDPMISESMSYDRFIQIKRVRKLNDNMTAKKRGEVGYNPAYKFDLILKVLVHNVGAMTLVAESDQCIDETTWAHNGFGEAQSGLVKLVLNKPGVTKGGQVVMSTDVHRFRPRAYVHRHSCHEAVEKWKGGPNEIRMLVNQMLAKSIGPVPQDDDHNKLFLKPFHITTDNYFANDLVIDWMGSKNLGMLSTNRRDRLPEDVPGFYWCKKKTTTTKRSKAARFVHPVVATKKYCTNGTHFERVHVSFQSTSSCNITTVNSLNDCRFYVRKKERGRGENRRLWAIEMNEARDLYLNSYGTWDTIDSLIKSANMYYRSWKYWHSAELHFKTMVMLVAFDMYRECAEGSLHEDWKLDKPVTWWQWRDKLAIQGLSYDPRKKMYPGDKHTRKSTQEYKKRRQPTKEISSSIVTIDQLKMIKEGSRREPPRISGDLENYCKHVDSLIHAKFAGACQVCGMTCWTRCGICKVPLHFYPQRGRNKPQDIKCFAYYHDEGFYGLARSDAPNKSQWRVPTTKKIKENRQHIKKLNFLSQDKTNPSVLF